MCDGGDAGAEIAKSDQPPDPAENFSADELKQNFLDGLNELQPRVEEATPVGQHGNQIVVWLGRWNLARYDTEYEEDETEVFAFLPAHFPEGDPHWVVFAPSPSPANRSLSSENNTKNNKFAKYIGNQFDVENPLAWSLRWSKTGFQPDNPEDMTRQGEIIKTALDLG